MKGKVALITGAKGGLGSYVTKAFLEAGAKVAGVSRSIQDSDFRDPRFKAFPAEISNAQAARDVVQSVAEEFGRVDALVHLMGGFRASPSVEETEDAAVENMMALNFWSAFYMVKAVMPRMRMQQSGAILAIGSRAAVEPAKGLAAYSPSKAALVSLIRTVALEGSDAGVSANVLLPGTMDTPANRSANPGVDYAKWVDPAQVAALLVHLASSQATNISGAVVPIHGREL